MSVAATADTTPPAGERGRSSLSTRLVAASLLLSLLVSALVTAVELRSLYVAESATAARRLDEIGNSIVPSIAASYWEVDLDRVGLLLDGIARLPGVAYVGLDGRDGEHLHRGERDAGTLLRRSFPLRYGEAAPLDLGTLEVVIGPRELDARLRARGGAIALTTTIALVSGALALLLLFRRRVTRHLEAMARYTRALHLSGLHTPLVLQRKPADGRSDELDQVVHSFNRMRETLIEELAVRDRHEAELVAHREHLEELVQARTAELDEKARELERQNRRIQELANTDALTGAHSRRHFYELAERELARARRAGEPLAVLLLDIDHFKRVNDQHGHAGGDVALERMARACREQLRDVDVVARMGGEEFAMLLPTVDTTAAVAVADRLRASLAALEIPLPGGGTMALTVSIGVAVLAPGDETIDVTLTRADAALYQAKREGRNRVCVHPAPPGPPDSRDNR